MSRASFQLDYNGRASLSDVTAAVRRGKPSDRMFVASSAAKNAAEVHIAELAEKLRQGNGDPRVKDGDAGWAAAIANIKQVLSSNRALAELYSARLSMDGRRSDVDAEATP